MNYPVYVFPAVNGSLLAARRLRAGEKFRYSETKRDEVLIFDLRNNAQGSEEVAPRHLKGTLLGRYDYEDFMRKTSALTLNRSYSHCTLTLRDLEEIQAYFKLQED